VVQVPTNIKNTIVLIVEDNVSNFILMARLLEHIGIQCEWKSSGYEVVEYANALPHIDLILMDIRLPYEDGYEALQKIRASKRLKDIPILAVTAYAGDEQMGRAKAAGFNGFLGKPLNPDLFSEQVRQMIAGEPVWVSQ
jgi:two-component system cell cycle response regulator DivK